MSKKKTYMTEDGYRFYVQPSGTVTNTKSGKNVDMSFKSIDEMFDVFPDIKVIKYEKRAEGGAIKKFSSGGQALRGIGKVIK